MALASKPTYDSGATFNNNNAKTTTTTKKVTTPVVPKQLTYKNMNTTDSTWYNQYSKSLQGGTANFADYKKYQDFASKYGLKQHQINQDALHDMSIKALSGDTMAQQYMQNMKINPQTGEALWNGVVGSQLDTNQSLRDAYMKDNPLTDYTKGYDMKQYDLINQKIANGQPMTPDERAYYESMTGKWGMDNQFDPYVQYRNQLGKNQEQALNAEDVALNQGMAQMDANSFNQFQSLQQDMSDRGMGDSGIASDAYMRATMGNNQMYQQAFADSARHKSDIKQQYTDLNYQSKVDQQNYKDNRADVDYNKAFEQQKYADERSDQAIQTQLDQAKTDVEKANALAKVQELQTQQDKYMSESTGMVYYNGKPLMLNGHTVPTLEARKLQETIRNNTFGNSVEQQKANTSAKNAEINLMNANTKYQKMVNDMATATQKLDLDWANYQLNADKIQAGMDNAKAKLDVAIKNANTSVDKNKLSAIKTQVDTVTKQINALRGKKKLTKDEKDTLKNLGKTLKSLMTKASNYVSSKK